MWSGQAVPLIVKRCCSPNVCPSFMHRAAFAPRQCQRLDGYCHFEILTLACFERATSTFFRIGGRRTSSLTDVSNDRFEGPFTGLKIGNERQLWAVPALLTAGRFLSRFPTVQRILLMAKRSAYSTTAREWVNAPWANGVRPSNAWRRYEPKTEMQWVHQVLHPQARAGMPERALVRVHGRCQPTQ